MAPSSKYIVHMDHAIPWSYCFQDLPVTNTCPLDSPLMFLYLLRKYGVVSQDRFQMDIKLTEVLNDIDAKSYDIARHLWVNHPLDNIGETRLVVTGTHWDLWSGSLVFTSVCNLFQMKLKCV